MASDGGRPQPRAGSRWGRRRVPLGRSAGRLGFERFLRLWVWSFALPALIAVGLGCRLGGASLAATAGWMAAALLLWALLISFFVEGVLRPLQTLSNIVAALREDDFSFRARGAMRGDALGDLALEINTLAGLMQRQRNAAMDALSLADRVIASMQSPVLAFDPEGRVRLLNAAAERALGLPMRDAQGRTAHELGMGDLLRVADQSVIAPERGGDPDSGPAPRWSVRRTVFRLHGVPHTLLVLSDVAAALREEERSAWQRLIRVLSHEINNSLTPIKSMASMLRERPFRLAAETHTSQDLSDLRRGLAMIEERADSLHRFLQAYGRLSRLPSPEMRRVSMTAMVEQSALLERRVPIAIQPSPEVDIVADPDQLQQLLINVFKNAAEAAADPELRHGAPRIEVAWQARDGTVTLEVVDNGPGLANPENLFVPFYTTKPEGTGIGLTLCRQIAAVHHGSIRLRNRDDVPGCIVELTLPLRPRVPAGD